MTIHILIGNYKKAKDHQTFQLQWNMWQTKKSKVSSLADFTSSPPI